MSKKEIGVFPSGFVTSGTRSSVLLCATNNPGIDVRLWLDQPNGRRMVVLEQAKHSELEASTTVSVNFIEKWRAERDTEWKEAFDSSTDVVYLFFTNRLVTGDVDALCSTYPDLAVVSSRSITQFLSPTLSHLVSAFDQDTDNWIGCDACKSWRKVPDSTDFKALAARQSWTCAEASWKSFICKKW